MTKIEEIDIQSITEEEFLDKIVQQIGEVKKNDDKTLSKDTFIRIFKYTGDFAKIRSKSLKQKSQEERCQFFMEDHKKYLDAL